MQRIEAKSSKRNVSSQVSGTCISCRERHLKCSGGLVCTRCAKNGSLCIFKPSRRGQKKIHSPQSPARVVESSLASATCVECRRSHLKCSGGPICTRCAYGGRDCSFRQSRRGQRSAKRSTATTFDTTVFVIAPADPMPSKLFFDPKLLRSFHYFQERASCDLSGHHDQIFWTSLILCISHSQPAIKHIVVALGFLHEALEVASLAGSDEEIHPLYRTSLRQYQEAIRLLKQNADELTTEVTMTSCVLLVCFETLQQDYKSAMNLIDSGNTILRQWRASAFSDHNHIDHEIVRVFSRVDLQASAFLRTASTKPTMLPKTRLPLPHVSMPASFSSLEEASICFDAIMEQVYSIINPLNSTPDYPLTSKLLVRFGTVLESWYNGLKDYLRSNPQIFTQSRKAVLYLKIQYYTSYFLTSSADEKGELRFDKFMSEFGLVVSFATEFLTIMALEDDSVPFSDTQSMHKFDLGIMPALFNCTLRCRCPRLRREVVQLLRKHQWRERSYNSPTVADMAMWVIEMEEQGLVNPQTCRDVPEANRIRIVILDRLDQQIVQCLDEDAPNREYETRWYKAPTTYQPCAFMGPQQILIRYARAPWDLTSRIEEAIINVS